MNAPVLPDVLLPREGAGAQPALPLASQGVWRCVWASRYGPILIEVRDGAVFVNGDRVQPHRG